MTIKKIIPFLLKACITFGIIYVISRKIDPAQVTLTLSRLSPDYVFLSLICFVMAHVFMALRWRRVVAQRSILLPFTRVFQQIYIGYFMSQGLPSSMGGDIYRGFMLVRSGVDMSWAVSSILLDRLCGLLTLTFFCLLFVPVQFQSLMHSSLGGIILGCSFFLITAVGAILACRWLPNFWPRLTGFLTFFSNAFWELIGDISFARVFFFSCGAMSASLFPIFIIAKDLDVLITLPQVFTCASVMLLAGALPLSLAGWGIREGALIISMGAFGIPSEQALSVSIVYGLIQLAASLPGGLIWFTYKKPTPEEIDYVRTYPTS